METGHLAGLERLEGPAGVGHVVAGRGLVHAIVPPSGRRLVVDDALQGLQGDHLGVRVLGHAVRLAKRICRYEGRVLVAIGAPEGYDLRARLVLLLPKRIDQVVERLLDRIAELLGGRRLAVGEEGQDRKPRVGDRDRRPAAVGLLGLLEPPESLEDGRLG